MGKKKEPVTSEDTGEGEDTVEQTGTEDEGTDGTDANGSPIAASTSGETQEPPDNPLQDAVENNVPTPRTIHERIKDIEFRWKKSFEHVMLDMHDHIFGASPPVPLAPPLPTDESDG